MDYLPSLATFVAFTAASLLLAATPGPDMTLSISRALSQGRGPALFVVLGTSMGIVVHTLLVAFGISALITASPTALLDSFMKVIGFSTSVRSPPRWPSATSPWKRCRQGEKTRRWTISSTAMNPTLCRCPA